MKMMLGNYRSVQDFRRLILTLKWMKEERTGGRKEREIESQREFAEGSHGNAQNTEIK